MPLLHFFKSHSIIDFIAENVEILLSSNFAFSANYVHVMCVCVNDCADSGDYLA